MIPHSAIIPHQRAALKSLLQRSCFGSTTTRQLSVGGNNNQKNNSKLAHHKRRFRQPQPEQRKQRISEASRGTESDKEVLEPATPSKIYSQFTRPKNHAQYNSKKRSKRDKAKQQLEKFVKPGAPVPTPFYYNHNRSSTGSSLGGGNFRMTRILSTLNAAALFDHTPSSSRDALLSVLRGQVLSRSRRSAYALTGHGVPTQVLQDHINMADNLLSREEHAAECSFNNFHGDLSFDWMRVRGRDGTNRASPWPKTSSESLEAPMELYLTVMNRLATTLGMVLMDDDDDDDQETRSISHWNVDILRGLAYPPQLLPSEDSKESQRRMLAPIIEWMPRNGISAPGHVCIRVQGFISSPDKNDESTILNRRRKKRLPVTLVFDACFRNKID